MNKADKSAVRPRLPLTPRPTRKTRAQRGETKVTVEERLLAATERLLAQDHTFGSLTIEQLTTEAGMSRGTFYLHFRDKGELVARLMKVVTDEVVDSTGTWVANAEKAQRADVVSAVNGVAQTLCRQNPICFNVPTVAVLHPPSNALAVEKPLPCSTTVLGHWWQVRWVSKVLLVPVRS